MIRRRADVVWQEIDGQAVALDLRSSRYFTINASGAALWELLADETDVPTMVAALVTTHGIDPGRAAADVDSFLSELRDNGLIEG